MKYLLDTTACIALINATPPVVRVRFEKALRAGAEMSPSVVAYELWYGVAKSGRPEKNAARVETFFAGPVEVLSFEDEDARAAGQVAGGA